LFFKLSAIVKPPLHKPESAHKPGILSSKYQSHLKLKILLESGHGPAYRMPMTNKLYADGIGPAYTYTPDGKLASQVERGQVSLFCK